MKQQHVRSVFPSEDSKAREAFKEKTLKLWTLGRRYEHAPIFSFVNVWTYLQWEGGLEPSVQSSF